MKINREKLMASLKEAEARAVESHEKHKKSALERVVRGMKRDLRDVEARAEELKKKIEQVSGGEINYSDHCYDTHEVRVAEAKLKEIQRAIRVLEMVDTPDVDVKTAKTFSTYFNLV